MGMFTAFLTIAILITVLIEREIALRITQSTHVVLDQIISLISLWQNDEYLFQWGFLTMTIYRQVSGIICVDGIRGSSALHPIPVQSPSANS